MQALAQAAAADIRAEVLRIVQQEGAGLPEAQREQVIGYLQQVPAMIRRSLSRPGDRSGKTVPPGMSLRRAEDLMPLLPPRLPRFKAGDWPLAGVDYELIELLGMGGYGEVWKAHNPHFDGLPPVALKFCLDPAATNRLLGHEAAMVNRVMRLGRHEGIVQLQQSFLSANPPCLAYEFIDGSDLAGVLHEHRQPGGGLAPDLAAKLVLRLAKIVGFAHGVDPPIVHRDLKPANILVRVLVGGKLELKVADYGIGGLAVKQAVDQTRRVISRQDFLTTAVRGAYTMLYASPQQMKGEEDPDPRDDVYSLGVIWYQLLTGDLTTGVSADWRDELEERCLGEAWQRLLGACVASKLEKRLANAAVLAEQITALLAKPTPAPRRTDTPPPIPVAPAVLKPAERKPGELFTNSLGMKFAWIPPGSFLMGSPPYEAERDHHETQHRVTLTRGFFMGVTPVTQTQWRVVIGDDPSHFKGGDLPVEMVSWHDCVEFCEKLNQKDGKPCRLPTEAEWEYACRSGTTTPFYFGETISTNQMNYRGDKPYGKGQKGKYRQKTTPVGSFPANVWGLKDMHGNVWEWCADRYGFYPPENTTDYKGPQRGDFRMLRGGSWRVPAGWCRAAHRVGYFPNSRESVGGVRVCFSPD